MDPAVYTVVTADIIKSRRIERRESEQGRIIRYLDELNGELGSFLTSQLSLSSGDQIQAVVSERAQAPALLTRLRGGLLPLRLRCGVGFGELTTSVHSSNPGWMDGPAFHNARRALDGLKGGPHGRTCWVGFGPVDDWLNALYGLLDAIQSRWTSGQWSAIRAYERFGQYEPAGKAMGISGSGVYQHCAAAHWEAYRRGEELAAQWLRESDLTVSGTTLP